MDLRGHGRSEKRLTAQAYHKPHVWADDVAAVIDHYRLTSVILCGWSFGCLSVWDYLQQHTSEKIIKAAVIIGGNATFGIPDVSGAKRPSNYSDLWCDDLAKVISASDSFASHCTCKQLTALQRIKFVAYSMLVPLSIRAAFRNNLLDYRPLLKNTKIPVLIIHGKLDQIISVDSAYNMQKLNPNFILKIYHESGHIPFLEQTDLFCQDLIHFIAALPE